MTDCVFGILIGLFILAALVIAGLVFFDWLFSQAGTLTFPLG